MSTDRIAPAETDTEENVLAVIRGEFRERQVDWKLRTSEGTFQNACEYYHNGELIHAGEWHTFEFVGINQSGTIVQFAALHGGGEMKLEDWIDSAAEEYLADELGEIWSDVKEMHDNK